MEIATQSEQDKLSIELDLTCRGDRGETLPFRISLHADAITLLISDAFRGDRVYEFFSIRRWRDIKRYLWCVLLKLPSGSGNVIDMHEKTWIDQRTNARFQHGTMLSF